MGIKEQHVEQMLGEYLLCAGTVLGARNSVVTRTGFASKAGNIEKYLGSQRAWA